MREAHKAQKAQPRPLWPTQGCAFCACEPFAPENAAKRTLVRSVFRRVPVSQDRHSVSSYASCAAFCVVKRETAHEASRSTEQNACVFACAPLCRRNRVARPESFDDFCYCRAKFCAFMRKIAKSVILPCKYPFTAKSVILHIFRLCSGSFAKQNCKICDFAYLPCEAAKQLRKFMWGSGIGQLSPTLT